MVTAEFEEPTCLRAEWCHSWLSGVRTHCGPERSAARRKETQRQRMRESTLSKPRFEDRCEESACICDAARKVVCHSYLAGGCPGHSACDAEESLGGLRKDDLVAAGVSRNRETMEA
eukprot:145514-Amphidinium_carterae.1